MKDDFLSINDLSFISILAEQIQRILVLRTLVRRGMRLVRYFHFEDVFEVMFPFSEYLTVCIWKVPTFSVNNLVCRHMLVNLCRSLNREGEPFID